MTTAGDLIEATRQHLVSAARPELNRLNGAVTDVATSLTFEFPAQALQRGAVLTLDLEQIYVWSTSGQSATVQRAWNGTVAAAHADDTLIWVNDRFPANVILAEINNELAAYSSPANGLYRVRTLDLTSVAVRSVYDLTGVTDLIGIASIDALDVLAGDRLRLERWRVIRNQDTADFPSGFGLRLYDYVLPGKAIRVVYKAPFTSLAALANDVATISGLPATAHDIPPLGAAARLLAGREARRNQVDAQPEPRTAADVPQGANTGASRALLTLRALRLAEEALRLAAAYPTVRTIAS